MNQELPEEDEVSALDAVQEMKQSATKNLEKGLPPFFRGNRHQRRAYLAQTRKHRPR